MSNTLEPMKKASLDAKALRGRTIFGVARPENGSGQKKRGFTLIELMIVVAVIAILGAIAMPQYMREVRKSRRTAAKTTLLDVASRQEKYYATQNKYGALTDLAYSSSTLQAPSATQDYYNVTLTLGTPTNGFTATASPQGDQQKDTCGTYSITNLGVQTVTGTDTNCW
jgi:type IV pilus assembly protein PilE